MFREFLKIYDIPRASVSETDFCSELKMTQGKCFRGLALHLNRCVVTKRHLCF